MGMKKSMIRIMICAGITVGAALAQNTVTTPARPKAPADAAIPSVHVVVPDIGPLIDTTIDDMEPSLAIEANEAMAQAADAVGRIQPMLNERIRAEVDANMERA